MSRQERRDFLLGVLCVLALFAFLALTGCIRVPVTVHPPANADGQPIALPTAPTGEVVNADGTVDALNPAFAKPRPSDHPPAPGFSVDWNALIGGVLLLLTGGGITYGRAQSTRAREHKADADEGWGKAVTYAEKLPPKES